MARTKCKTLREFAREEGRTSIDYARRGFLSQARDEARHSKFFRKRAKECE